MRPNGRDEHSAGDVRGRRIVLTEAAVTAIAELLGVDPGDVSTTTPFAELGLSSLQLARLTAQLEDAMGVEVSLAALYDHPDIEQLAEFLAMR
ncbi:acyl carrier protein [Nocardia puris]|uniref:Acyl carrier protein n=1 Tax=Nocardia puris TaxID=208602 RepID=A0A366DQR5_9NOCA|nr:acyl carrier protein [Nocardia puris]MBF6213587.1 acyl carrier protein [Nocardia puris]MBF6365483.1 acyl carrier protein [Nocardia puris]MBF6459949.1 acyl carrier protein [Nocardia puris]RBO91568.1 acyl carrier protein [Nocardia puris]